MLKAKWKMLNWILSVALIDQMNVSLSLIYKATEEEENKQFFCFALLWRIVEMQ